MIIVLQIVQLVVYVHEGESCSRVTLSTAGIDYIIPSPSKFNLSSHVINAGQLEGEYWVPYHWIVITKKFRTQDNLHFRTNAKFSSGNCLFKFLATHIVCCIAMFSRSGIFNDAKEVRMDVDAALSPTICMLIPKCTETCTGRDSRTVSEGLFLVSLSTSPCLS